MNVNRAVRRHKEWAVVPLQGRTNEEKTSKTQETKDDGQTIECMTRFIMEGW